MAAGTSNTVVFLSQAQSKKPGLHLRQMRLQAGLTMRDVVVASKRLAKKRGDPRYGIVVSRLSMMEQCDVVPGIFRLYTLSAVYGSDIGTLLKLYGIE